MPTYAGLPGDKNSKGYRPEGRRIYRLLITDYKKVHFNAIVALSIARSTISWLSRWWVPIHTIDKPAPFGRLWVTQAEVRRYMNRIVMSYRCVGVTCRLYYIYLHVFILSISKYIFTYMYICIHICICHIFIYQYWWTAASIHVAAFGCVSRSILGVCL